MSIKELEETIETIPKKDLMPTYFNPGTDAGLMGATENLPVNAWGILVKDGLFIYIETYELYGVIAYKKVFEEEKAACDYALNIIRAKYRANPAGRSG